jgi:hypothetical protein
MEFEGKTSGEVSPFLELDPESKGISLLFGNHGVGGPWDPHQFFQQLRDTNEEEEVYV